MRAEGVTADRISYGTMMKAAASRSDVSRMEALLDEMMQNGIEPDVVILNTMLAAYARAARHVPAYRLFRKLKVPPAIFHCSLPPPQPFHPSQPSLQS